MRIAFFIRCMSNGGAEKVAAQLTHIWSGLGHGVVVFTELPQSDKEYDFKFITREIVTDAQRGSKEALLSLYEKYHFEVAIFNDGINAAWFESAFLTIRSLGVKTIVINHHTANNWMYGCWNTHELFMDEVLSTADAMVCVDKMWALWWKYRGVQSIYIPNPVDSINVECKSFGTLELVKTIDEAVEKLKGMRNIVWMGRLNDCLKRPELAIEVFSKVAKISSGVKMVMLGKYNRDVEKRLRAQLETFSPNYNGQLLMPGFVANTDEYLKRADVHLFTSVTEVTIPQAVLEASIAGVNTVAFDMPVLRVGLDQMSQDRKRIADKWNAVLGGERLSCDYDDIETRTNLLGELHRAQQWFVRMHLPELMGIRRVKMRMNPAYLLRRLVEKTRGKLGS